VNAFSNQNMAQDYIARVVIGRTKVGEDFKLTHSSSACSRRKRKGALSLPPFIFTLISNNLLFSFSLSFSFFLLVP
jgi:uncharacterized membrane protein